MRHLSLIALSILVLSACGKYDKPFISFRSAEKRIMDKVWETKKIIDKDGQTLTQIETLELKIEGEDSTFVRTYSINNNVDTVTGKWRWQEALKDKWNKQILVLRPTGANINRFDIRVLTSKKMELIDRDGPSTAFNEYFFEVK
jgi:hypothetical protein